ncbi:MAG: hypothetical protein V7L23_30300 [Nostoc sp.]|uniref:hypothetical protein n=1 Tax=Nostoc sp. TaxID=1180 RepID=UPI002FF12B2C
MAYQTPAYLILVSEADGIFLTDMGNSDQLVDCLEHLAIVLPQNPVLRDLARFCAERFTWQQFRASLWSFL